MVDICSQVENFCGVRFESSDQHVDARDSRIARDFGDLGKLKAWIKIRDPFPYTDKLISLATGLVGGEDVNAHDAFLVGKASIENQVHGNKFCKISFKRKHRVTPLMNGTSSVKVNDNTFSVDPLMIFQRICLTQECKADLENHLAYELAPYPLSIFDNGVLRKTAKSALLKLFSQETASIDKKNCVHVVDGGMLIHRVPWKLMDKFEDIFERYVKYFEYHYSPGTTVVFDGYGFNRDSMKGSERARRTHNKSCPDVQFDPSMSLTVQKDKFLSNVNNKIRFIEYLKQALEKNKISVKQAVDDADVLIVHTALEKYSSNGPAVIVVAEDIDILVLITALTPVDQKIYFMKVEKGHKGEQIFSSTSLDGEPFIRDNILFLHAVTGTDTTSAFFRKGKKSVVENLRKLVKENHELRKAIENFKDPHLSQESVFSNGLPVLLSIYNAPDKVKNLTILRFKTFQRLSRQQKAIDLASLPPTTEAARQHFYRAYLQVQHWLSNQLSPEEWGWKRGNDVLVPIQTTKEPADPKLLKLIFCQCKGDCEQSSRCSCRRAGLRCSSICGSCQSNQCENYKDAEVSMIPEEVEAEEDTGESPQNHVENDEIDFDNDDCDDDE